MGYWGAGQLFMPHMITADREGNVWVTDAAAHVALKYTPEGKELLRLGTPNKPGSGPRNFCKPTDVRLPDRLSVCPDLKPAGLRCHCVRGVAGAATERPHLGRWCTADVHALVSSWCGHAAPCPVRGLLRAGLQAAMHGPCLIQTMFHAGGGGQQWQRVRLRRLLQPQGG